MSTQVTTESKPQSTKTPRPPLNGVDTPNVFATIGAVRAQPELGLFCFRASNEWVNGTHSRSRTEVFSGAGGEHHHVREYSYDADHPAVLVGADHGPTPVEFLLHAVASCLTAGIANISAARGVPLRSVRSIVEGDIDLRGIFGITDEVRNGFQTIRIAFEIDGDAPDETLRELLEQSKRRSAVYDVLTRGLPVEVAVKTRA